MKKRESYILESDDNDDDDDDKDLPVALSSPHSTISSESNVKRSKNLLIGSSREREVLLWSQNQAFQKSLTADKAKADNARMVIYSIIFLIGHTFCVPIIADQSTSFL